MAVVIDSRLREAESEPNLAENFNRVLALVDALEERVEALEESEETQEGSEETT